MDKLKTFLEFYNGNVKKSLYTHRPLLNHDEFEAWAKEQGFESVSQDTHATVAYSKQPVDWNRLPRHQESVIATEGDRKVAPLGDKGAIVLHFESPDLHRDHHDIRAIGASWDWDTFKPHVTITYEGHKDLDKVQPYTGPLKFGPEVHDVVNEDWKPKEG